MPRTARASVGGIAYHVINRGNGRRDVFLKDGDFQAFLKAMAHACIEVPMPVLGFCLMSNQFHLVVLPKEDGDLSRWMHWLLNAHVRRYQQHYHSSGHVWQGSLSLSAVMTNASNCTCPAEINCQAPAAQELPPKASMSLREYNK